MRTWTFHSADGLVFGREAVRQLPDVARRLKAKRVFVVTDKVPPLVRLTLPALDTSEPIVWLPVLLVVTSVPAVRLVSPIVAAVPVVVRLAVVCAFSAFSV